MTPQKEYNPAWLTRRRKQVLQTNVYVQQALVVGKTLGIQEDRIYQMFPGDTKGTTQFSDDTLSIYLAEIKALARGIEILNTSGSRCGLYTTVWPTHSL